MENEDNSTLVMIFIDQILLQQSRTKKTLYGQAYCCFEEDLDRVPT